MERGANNQAFSQFHAHRLPDLSAMRDYSSWSLNWGTWGGVRVRLHASLLVAGVLAWYLAARVNGPTDVSLYGLLGAAILLASVLVHELGHCLAALRLGGSVDAIVLSPLGGLVPPNVPHEPQREVTVALAGPLANLLVMMLVGPALILSGVSLGDLLLQPLYPAGLLQGEPLAVGLKLAFWINWFLLGVNLFPAAPLDGGRALRSVLWPVMGYREAVRVVSRSGMLLALALCVVAWFLHSPREFRLIPAWLPLVLMAIFLYFSARQEAARVEDQETDDDLFGYDFSQGYTSLERTVEAPRRRRPSRLRRWLLERREQKARRLHDLEQEEERRVDEVLVRVKQVGLGGVSPEERALLQRVSARYRNRSRQS